MTVAIVKWQRLTEPVVGKTIGFTAVSWHGLIVDSIPVSIGPRGLFISMPARRVRNGRYLKVVRFKTVREETAFKTEVLAILSRAGTDGSHDSPLERDGFELQVLAAKG